jgi:predicted TIM-barrel fold metal-dependent hydrolase
VIQGHSIENGTVIDGTDATWFSRMKLRTLALALSLPLAVAETQRVAITPVGDFHQHLFSPAAVAMLNQPRGIAATDLIVLLDSAGIQGAALLSVAYMYGAPIREVEDEYAKVRAENDWNAAEAARYPTRLRAICSVNPLKAYALEEIARCAKTPGLTHGVKLHFGNSDVRTDSTRHLDLLKRVFRAANDSRMAIIVHMHANINNHRPFGAEQGRTFLEQLLPEAPDVPVQIAHLAGAGSASDIAADSALAVFADAIARNDPRMKNVWFDVTAVVDMTLTPVQGEHVAARIRQLGVSRVLYGSDAAATPASAPKNAWAMFRRIPLTEQEFSTIAANVPPYMR